MQRCAVPPEAGTLRWIFVNRGTPPQTPVMGRCPLYPRFDALRATPMRLYTPIEMASESAARPEKRILYLNRRVAFIEPGRINVRPALAAALFPLVWLLLGIACFVSILLWLDTLPFALVLALLVVAVVSIPLAGIGFVYAVGGANVVFDSAKGSGVWQQGFLGMGVGTTELVPFAKIEQIRIEETTRDNLTSVDIRGRRHSERQDVAQFEVVLVKVSGKRLKVGDVVVARSMVREGLADARGLAEAIAEMTGKPLIAPEVVRRVKGAPSAEADAADAS